MPYQGRDAYSVDQVWGVQSANRINDNDDALYKALCGTVYSRLVGANLVFISYGSPYSVIEDNGGGGPPGGFIALGVQAGHQITIRKSGDPYNYQRFTVTQVAPGGNINRLQVQGNLATFTGGAGYEIIRNIDTAVSGGGHTHDGINSKLVNLGKQWKKPTAGGGVTVGLVSASTISYLPGTMPPGSVPCDWVGQNVHTLNLSPFIPAGEVVSQALLSFDIDLYWEEPQYGVSSAGDMQGVLFSTGASSYASVALASVTVGPFSLALPNGNLYHPNPGTGAAPSITIGLGTNGDSPDPSDFNGKWNQTSTIPGSAIGSSVNAQFLSTKFNVMPTKMMGTSTPAKKYMPIWSHYAPSAQHRTITGMLDFSQRAPGTDNQIKICPSINRAIVSTVTYVAIQYANFKFNIRARLWLYTTE